MEDLNKSFSLGASNRRTTFSILDSERIRDVVSELRMNGDGNTSYQMGEERRRIRNDWKGISGSGESLAQGNLLGIYTDDSS